MHASDNLEAAKPRALIPVPYQEVDLVDLKTPKPIPLVSLESPAVSGLTPELEYISKAPGFGKHCRLSSGASSCVLSVEKVRELTAIYLCAA
jgi:hypothetical protein